MTDLGLLKERLNKKNKMRLGTLDELENLIFGGKSPRDLLDVAGIKVSTWEDLEDLMNPVRRINQFAKDYSREFRNNERIIGIDLDFVKDGINVSFSSGKVFIESVYLNRIDWKEQIRKDQQKTEEEKFLETLTEEQRKQYQNLRK